MKDCKASVVVTGTAWMGGGIGSIESALERLFREAKHDVLATAFSIGTGANVLLEWMERSLARGIRNTLIVNGLASQPASVIQQLYDLTAVYRHFHLYDFTGDADLHAKVVVVDHRVALVGSSNLSRRGLLANHELAVLLEGDAAADVARALNLLIASPQVTRVTSVPQ